MIYYYVLRGKFFLLLSETNCNIFLVSFSYTFRITHYVSIIYISGKSTIDVLFVNIIDTIII